MLKRTITGAFITAAVYLVLYFSHIPAVMLCATAVMTAFAVYEIYHAAGFHSNTAFLILSLLCAIGLSIWEIPNYDQIVTIVFLIAVSVFVLMMFLQKRVRIDHAGKAAFVSLLVILLFKAFPELRGFKHGLSYLVGAVTLCFVTDVFAYLVGSRFGRHKLLPKVSPNKTIEGSVAGIAAAVLFMLLYGFLLERGQMMQVNDCLLVVYALLASIVGQFGDLAMSAVKRICGVKDFGYIFPGHGGILDRFDSHIFAVSFTMIFCNMTGGYIL